MKIASQPQTNLYKSTVQAPADKQVQQEVSTQSLSTDSVSLQSKKSGKSLGGALLATAIGAGQGYLTSKFSDGSTWGAAKFQGGVGAVTGAVKGGVTGGVLGYVATGGLATPFVIAGGSMGALTGGITGLVSGAVLGAVSNHLVPAEGKTAAFAIGGGAINLAGYLLK